MPESGFHVRIVVKPRPDGLKHLFLVDVHSLREVDTMQKCHPHQLDATIRRIKEDLEKKGHRVSVREI